MHLDGNATPTTGFRKKHTPALDNLHIFVMLIYRILIDKNEERREYMRIAVSETECHRLRAFLTRIGWKCIRELMKPITDTGVVVSYGQRTLSVLREG